MTFLKVVEVPLTVLIAVIALVEHGYSIFYSSLESEKILDENALPLKDIIVVAFAVMSLIGTISSKPFFGCFTFAFMLYNFILASFNLFHVTNLVIRSFSNSCQQIHIKTVELTETECWIVDGMLLSLTVITVVMTALATVAVYERLTTVTLPISDSSRQQATRRRLVESSESASEQGYPVLISRVPVESPVVDFTTKKFKNDTFSPVTDYYV